MPQFPKVFYTVLQAKDDPAEWLDDPAIQEGDFQISPDGTSFVNLSILPVVTPAGSPQIKIELTDNERNVEASLILGHDQLGDEWRDISLTPQDCKPTITKNTVEGGADNELSAQVAAVGGMGGPKSVAGMGGSRRVSGRGRISGSGGSGGPR